MSLLGFCQWLESTAWSVALHESLWLYPLIESTHVLALCLFLGTVFLLDLRLVGWAFPTIPVSAFTSRLLPFTFVGLAVMLATGVLLFYAIPVRTYLNVFFRAKLIMLALAGINALVFHATIHRSVAAWDHLSTPPPRARLAGALSLALWTGIVIAGRMIAYNWFDAPGVH